MDVTILLPALAVGTLAGVGVLAYRSKKEVEAEKRNPNHRKSTLANDAPDKFQR